MSTERCARTESEPNIAQTYPRFPSILTQIPKPPSEASLASPQIQSASSQPQRVSAATIAPPKCQMFVYIQTRAIDLYPIQLGRSANADRSKSVESTAEEDHSELSLSAVGAEAGKADRERHDSSDDSDHIIVPRRPTPPPVRPKKRHMTEEEFQAARLNNVARTRVIRKKRKVVANPADAEILPAAGPSTQHSASSATTNMGEESPTICRGSRVRIPSFKLTWDGL